MALPPAVHGGRLASAALVQSLRTSCPLATLIPKGISFGHTSMYVVLARRARLSL